MSVPNRPILRPYQFVLWGCVTFAYRTGRALRFWANKINPSTMWNKKPRTNPISIRRIRGLVPMKCPQWEKAAPPSFKKIMALIVQWMSRKVIRNKPVSDIISFLPIELVNSLVNQFIGNFRRLCSCKIPPEALLNNEAL